MAFESFALESPSAVQLTATERTARIASQVVAETAATPLWPRYPGAPLKALEELAAPATAPTGTSANTPAGLLPSEPTVPPKTGLCLTAAKSMPGKTTSIPNLADPLTLAGTSSRAGELPTKRRGY